MSHDTKHMMSIFMWFSGLKQQFKNVIQKKLKHLLLHITKNEENMFVHVKHRLLHNRPAGQRFTSTISKQPLQFKSVDMHPQTLLNTAGALKSCTATVSLKAKSNTYVHIIKLKRGLGAYPSSAYKNQP